MPKYWIHLAFVLFCIVNSCYADLFSRKSARVLIDSWAKPEFVESRTTPDGPARLSYHFFEGKLYGGFIKDNSLDRISLQDIADALAEDMEAQNYFPAKSFTDGDLVIIVHWGVTSVQENLDELFPGDLESGSDTSIEDSSDVETTGSYPDLSFGGFNNLDAKNARLLGIDKALAKKSLSTQERNDLRQTLKEERYFIILMAYDWQHLQKTKERDLLWITRFSLSSQGTNFDDAYPALSRAAAPHFGVNLVSLSQTKTNLGWGKATVGELEVIESFSEDQLEDAKQE